jgi:hypothetical protein
VRDRVGQHAGQFVFAPGREEQIGGNEDISTRQGQRLVGRAAKVSIHDGERVLYASVRQRGCQFVAHPRHITADPGVVDYRALASDLGGKLSAQSSFFFSTVEIRPRAAFLRVREQCGERNENEQSAHGFLLSGLDAALIKQVSSSSPIAWMMRREGSRRSTARRHSGDVREDEGSALSRVSVCAKIGAWKSSLS